MDRLQGVAPIDKVHATFGERLKGYRTARGLSRRQLAQRAGASTVYVGQLERGEKSPTLRILAALAGVLEVRASDLVGYAKGSVRRRSGERPVQDLDRHFGWALFKLRERRGYSMQEVAGRGRLSPSYLKQLIAGRQSPTLTTLIKLGRALFVPAEELVRAAELHAEGKREFRFMQWNRAIQKGPRDSKYWVDE